MPHRKGGPSEKTPLSGDETTPLAQGGLGSRFRFGRGLDGADLGGGTPPPSYVVGSDNLHCNSLCLHCMLRCIVFTWYATQVNTN